MFLKCTQKRTSEFSNLAASHGLFIRFDFAATQDISSSERKYNRDLRHVCLQTTQLAICALFWPNWFQSSFPTIYVFPYVHHLRFCMISRPVLIVVRQISFPCWFISKNVDEAELFSGDEMRCSSRRLWLINLCLHSLWKFIQ